MLRLRFCGDDDIEQFAPRVEPVAVQEDVRAIIDESRRAYEGCRDPVACVILPAKALERPPQLASIA